MNKEKLEIRRKEKQQRFLTAQIEAEKNQKPIESIIINIEWKKSKMWGVNPYCKAEIRYRDNTFETSPIYTTSGCGYDKGSTVIAQVFNNYLKYKLWLLSEEQMKNNVPYGITYSFGNRYYVEAIGVDCYCDISKYIGGKFEQIASGEFFNVYKYTDLKSKKGEENENFN